MLQRQPGRTLVEPIHSLQGAYSIIHAILKQAGRNTLLGSSPRKLAILTLH